MKWFFGLLLILLGVLFLGDNLGWFDFNLGRFIRHYWPLALVAVGGWLIYHQMRCRSWSKEDWTTFGGRNFSRTMGDVNLKPDHLDSSGLKIEQGLGNIKLDLSGTALNNGENQVECSLGLGDAKIIIPKNVPLSATCSAGIGDVHVLDKYDDGFAPKVIYQDTDYANAEKKIRLIAKVGLGDVKVTHG